MSGRIYAILDENGARVEDQLLQAPASGVDVGTVGIGVHEHSGSDIHRLIGDFVSAGVRNVPEYVEHYQKRSMQMHNNKHTWFLGIIGLFFSVLFLYLLIRRVRTRWMRAMMIRDAEQKREMRKVKKAS
jgi:hypothetical protein